MEREGGEVGIKLAKSRTFSKLKVVKLTKKQISPYYKLIWMKKVFLWLLRGLDQEIQAEKEAWAQKS